MEIDLIVTYVLTLFSYKRLNPRILYYIQIDCDWESHWQHTNLGPQHFIESILPKTRKHMVPEKVKLAIFCFQQRLINHRSFLKLYHLMFSMVKYWFLKIFVNSWVIPINAHGTLAVHILMCRYFYQVLQNAISDISELIKYNRQHLSPHMSVTQSMRVQNIQRVISCTSGFILTMDATQIILVGTLDPKPHVRHHFAHNCSHFHYLFLVRKPL